MENMIALPSPSNAANAFDYIYAIKNINGHILAAEDCSACLFAIVPWWHCSTN